MGRCQGAQVSSDADSKRKPDVAADSVFKAAFEQQTATEAQKLEEVARGSSVCGARRFPAGVQHKQDSCNSGKQYLNLSLLGSAKEAEQAEGQGNTLKC